MKLLRVLLTVALTAATVIGQLSENEGQERILGGTNALQGEFPYLVSIAVDGNHTCAGFIYNEEWVVTSAACVESFSSMLFNTRVVVGQISLITDDVPYEKAYEIFNIIKFDGYNNVTRLHDLAMIQTSDKIEFSDGVGCQFYEEADTVPNQGTIMGWGANFQNATIPSTRLKKGTITNLAADCSTYTGFDRNYMICAGTPADDGVAPCRFDEGGPLVQNNVDGVDYVVGIFSRTAGCESGRPAVFTRLAPYYAWFEKIAKKQPVDVCGTSTETTTP